MTSKDHICVQSEKEAADIWGSGPLLPIGRARVGEAESDIPSAYLRTLIVVVTCLVAVFGCDLVPQKPEAVFRLYRERMRSGQLEQARSLLSRESAILAQETATRYLLRHPPENLALLNTLDPVAEAVPVKVGKINAIVRVRTLKGGLRLIHLVKQDGDANSSWKIDLSKELEAFRSFLAVRGALEMIREQAGEYAATLKAFRDQLDRMPAPEPEPSESTNKKKIKEKTSKGTKKKKSSSKTRPGRKKGRR